MLNGQKVQGPPTANEVNFMLKARDMEDRLVDLNKIKKKGARCSSVVRAFAHGAMGRWIDPSWGGPIELFLIPASAPRLV